MADLVCGVQGLDQRAAAVAEVAHFAECRDRPRGRFAAIELTDPAVAVELLVVAQHPFGILGVEDRPFAAPREVEHPVAAQQVGHDGARKRGQELAYLRVDEARAGLGAVFLQPHPQSPEVEVVGERVAARELGGGFEADRVVAYEGPPGLGQRLVGLAIGFARSGRRSGRRRERWRLCERTRREDGGERGRERAYNREQRDPFSHYIFLWKITDLRSSIPCGAGSDRHSTRGRLLALRKAIPQAYRRSADAAIAVRLREWLAGREPGVLALWWPLAGEPDLSGEFEALSRIGWTIALPHVVATDAPLAFGRWRPGIAMREQRHRVCVPDPFEPVTPSVLVAPCLGFDVRGWRLGYGGGYYDRTLAASDIAAAGAAYDACEIGLEPDPHDRPLEAILTESRLLRCR